MANKVEIDIIANNLADSALQAVQQSLKNIGGTAGAVGLAAVTMGAAIVTAMTKAASAAQTYDQRIKELMLRTGGTAEETSRLVQTVDDAGISYETLSTAMRFAVKNGIEPNIKGLAALSDQYKALDSPIERGQFLLDKFGRSGMDMARAMELGGDALLQMSESMAGGLILTEANIAASESYRKTLDNLDDTAQGLEMSLGNKVIPVYDDLLKIVTANINAVDEFSGTFRDLDNIMKLVPPGADRAAAAINLIADAAARALNSNLPSFMRDTASAVSNSTDKYIAMAQAMQSTNEIVDTMEPNYQQMISLTQQLEGATVQAANSISYNMLMAKLSVDGLTQAEYELGQQAGVSMGIFSQKTADTASKINYMTDMVIKGKLNVELLRAAIESLRDRDISINVAIQGAYASQFQSNQQSNAANNPDHTYNTPGRATGGSVMAGRPYMVGEAGRELFVPSQNGNIVPNDKLGSGGSTVINFTYAPAFSAATNDEMQNKLLPFIIEGIRQANLR